MIQNLKRIIFNYICKHTCKNILLDFLMITQSAPMPYLLNSKSEYMVQFLPKHTIAWPARVLAVFSLVYAFECAHLPPNFELVSYLFAFESVANLLWCTGGGCSKCPGGVLKLPTRQVSQSATSELCFAETIPRRTCREASVL